VVGLGHDGRVTDPTDRPGSPLPPDPEQYDAVRNEHARKRGLNQPYISGGNDPELPETLRRERFYLRILIAMVVLIIVIGFGLGIVEALMTAPTG
jgi:hypothetical protein